jgi:hypothetical protein
MKTLTASFVMAVAVLGMGLSSARADQPHMQAALDALRTARAELKMAEHNKGGHRERALEHVNAAIGQVESGMAFAR